jgi:hypothetical protein
MNAEPRGAMRTASLLWNTSEVNQGPLSIVDGTTSDSATPRTPNHRTSHTKFIDNREIVYIVIPPRDIRPTQHSHIGALRGSVHSVQRNPQPILHRDQPQPVPARTYLLSPRIRRDNNHLWLKHPIKHCPSLPSVTSLARW